MAVKKLAGEAALGQLKESLESKINSGFYDDTALKADIQANTAAIARLNGVESAEGSVAYTAAQAVAKIVAAAPGDFDTLKEIADWISGHADDAASMNSGITNNKNAVDALKLLVGDTAVATQITEAIAGLNLAETYATAAALTGLSGRVKALEDAGYITRGGLSVTVTGTGNAVTGMAYNTGTGVFTVTMGAMLAPGDIQEITAEEVQGYFTTAG